MMKLGRSVRWRLLALTAVWISLSLAGAAFCLVLLHRLWAGAPDPAGSQEVLVWALAVLCAAGLAMVLIWWSLALAAVCASEMSKDTSAARRGTRCRILAPSLMRRAAAGALGLGLVAWAPAAWAAPTPVPTAHAAQSSSPLFAATEKGADSPTGEDTDDAGRAGDAATGQSSSTQGLEQPSLTHAASSSLSASLLLALPTAGDPGQSHTPQETPRGHTPPTASGDSGYVPISPLFGGTGPQHSGEVHQPGITDTSSPARAGGPASGTGESTATNQYVVVRGDSLWSIAAARTDASRGEAEVQRLVARIAATNADRLPEGPDLLYPGTVLVLPGS